MLKDYHLLVKFKKLKHEFGLVFYKAKKNLY